MFLVYFWQDVTEMFMGVIAAAPFTIPFIFLLWSITVFNEKRRIPRTREDFQELREDGIEFLYMNGAVLVIFAAQIIVVSLISAGLGI